MLPNFPEKLPDSIDNALKNTTDKPTKEIGGIVGDILYLISYKIHHKADCTRIISESAKNAIEKLCQKHINDVPVENLVKPNMQNIYQALEDAKYCDENENVRDMFAHLIAATTDSRICDDVHPSFSNILKQMSSQDAKFFKLFKNKPEIPVCNFQLIDSKTNGFDELFEYAYFENKNSDYNEVLDTSFILSTLERLGLIKVSFVTFISGDTAYKVYEESSIFEKLKTEYTIVGKTVGFQKGVARLTVLGQRLLKVCCPDEIVAEASISETTV